MKNWEPLVSLPALAMPNCGQIYPKITSDRWGILGILTQLALLGVAELEVLIFEFVAVDRLATSA